MAILLKVNIGNALFEKDAGVISRYMVIVALQNERISDIFKNVGAHWKERMEYFTLGNSRNPKSSL